MMANYQIQTPIDQDIKSRAEEKAKNLGLKNINDTVRFLLTNFANDRVSISIAPEEEIEAYRRELEAELEEVKRGLKDGSVKSFSSVDEMMEALNS